jgi:hypothetical protein
VRTLHACWCVNWLELRLQQRSMWDLRLQVSLVRTGCILLLYAVAVTAQG